MLVNVGSVCMSSLSFIVDDDGGKHVAKERQVVVGE
jgi:hypothetical protein